MNIKSGPCKVSLRIFYISLGIFLLSLLIVYSSSNESNEFFPSLREILRLFFHWIILPICFLLSVIGGSLAATAMRRVQNKRSIIGLLLNTFMVLAYCGYLWAYHSDYIYLVFEMNSRERMSHAVSHNKLWLVKWELMRGADVNAKYDHDETLLMYSVRHHNQKMMELVLDYDPDVNVYCDIQGNVQTPLLNIAGVAVSFSSVTSTQKIQRSMTLRRFKTQDPDRQKRTAAMLALSSESPDASGRKDWQPLKAARLLLKHGADPDLRLKNSDRKRGHVDVTAVSLAYENGKSDLVDLLLAHGADVNVRTMYQEQTLLHAAVENRDTEMVQRLVGLGAELNVKDQDNVNGSKSPLHAAVALEDIGSVKILVEHGAHVNAMFSEGIGGCTPLHLAVMTGNLELVQFLLDHHADVNAKAVSGKTPLHLAVDFSEGKTEIVKLLMVSSASPDVGAVFVDIDGKTESYTPLSLARKRHYTAVSELLLSYDAVN